MTPFEEEVIRLNKLSDTPYEDVWRSTSDIDHHWHRVHSVGRIISFSLVMGHWEFHLADGDGYIKMLLSFKNTKTQVKGYGKASQVAKALVRMSDKEFETSRFLGSWSSTKLGL